MTRATSAQETNTVMSVLAPHIQEKVERFGMTEREAFEVVFSNFMDQFPQVASAMVRNVMDQA